MIYETNYVLFECIISGILPQIETETTLNVTWTGSYGVIQSNDTYNISTIMLNETNYLSILNITSVNVTVHNDTLYTCSVVLMVNASFTRSSFIVPGKASATSDRLIVQGEHLKLIISLCICINYSLSFRVANTHCCYCSSW